MYTGTLAAVSNQQDWVETGTIIDDDGEDVTLTDATFEMYICRQNDSKNAVLTATNANGKITLPTATSFQWWFTQEDMNDLCAGTYDVFMRVTIDGIVEQIMSATVPVVEGGPNS
jgi:hypothetical protein